MNEAFVTSQSPSTAFYFRPNISASSTEFYLGYCVYFRFISFIHIRMKIAHRLQAIVTAKYIHHKDCKFLNIKKNSNGFFVNLIQIQILIDFGMKISKPYLSLRNVKNEHFSGGPRTIKPKSDVSDIPLRVCFFSLFVELNVVFCHHVSFIYENVETIVGRHLSANPGSNVWLCVTHRNAVVSYVRCN